MIFLHFGIISTDRNKNKRMANEAGQRKTGELDGFQ